MPYETSWIQDSVGVEAGWASVALGHALKAYRRHIISGSSARAAFP